MSSKSRIGMAALVAATVIPMLNASRPAAQSPAGRSGRPAFDVASVKTNKSGGERGGRLQPGDFAQINVTLRQLIRMAYGTDEISGGPGWIDADRFDIEGKGEFGLAAFLPAADGSPPLVYVRLQTLLADRFKLTVHRETRERPVYALVMASRDGQLGPQLHRSDIDCVAVMAALVKGERPPVLPDPDKGPPCSMRAVPGHLTAHAVSPSWLARALSSSVDRVVIDRTGLVGNFDVDLEWAPELRSPTSPDAPEVAAAAGDAGSSIFTRVQEQLGLKLNPERGTVDILVVDLAARPEAN